MSTEQSPIPQVTEPVKTQATGQECQHVEVLQKATMDWLLHDVIGQRPTASGIILMVILLAGAFISRRFK